MSTSVEVPAPAEEVWHLIATFDRWAEWGPSIAGAEAAAHEVAPGVTGRVRTAVGAWLPFEVTEVTPGRSWAWRVAGIPATGHRVDPIGEGHCRVTFTTPWPTAPYLAVLAMALRRVRDLASRTPES
jgi:uncharacterized protein YndB with AHSA1/START domain